MLSRYWPGQAILSCYFVVYQTENACQPIVVSALIPMPTDFSQQRLRVLCLSRDQRLLETRGMVLAKHYDAAIVGSIEEMRALPVVTQFDVVVICHSLLPEECDLSALIAKERWPKAKIVALSIMRPAYRSFADQVVRGIDGPEILLQAIDRVTRASPRSSCHI